MLWLKQSTAIDIGMGPFLDDTDGKTAETGLTITQPDIRLKKNGGAWAQKNAAQTLTHEEAGWYEVALDTTDTDTLGCLLVAIAESGALPVWREFMVVPANVYDSLVGGSDLLDASVVQLAGDATSLTDLKDFADAGYDPVTNKVEGVKLADTLTTYTGNTVQTGDSFARLGAPVGASHSADVAAVKTETASIQSDTNDLQTRLPAALVSGRIDASVGAMAANVLTAAAINADAITDAKVAADVTIASVTGAVGSVTGAVGSVTGAVGSVTGNVGGNVTGSVGSVVGAVGSVAAGGITAASFAVDAIDAAALKADAVAEIAAGVKAIVVDGTITLAQILQIIAAAVSGKLAGAETTTVTIRDVNDTRNCIVATVDADGNRSAVTYSVV